MTLLDLPAELWTLVINQLELDGAQRTIATLSETCKLCHGLLQPILFSKPELDSPRSWQRYAVVWKQQINPWSIATRQNFTPEWMKPVGLSFSLARDDGPRRSAAPYAKGWIYGHEPPCSVPWCLSPSHSTIDHCPLPLSLIGAFQHGAFTHLTSLKFDRCRILDEMLTTLLGPLSSLRRSLTRLELTDVAVEHQTVLFVLELWRLGCMWPLDEWSMEEYHQEDEEIVDYPRGADGKPTPALAALAMDDFPAFKRLWAHVKEDDFHSVLLATAAPSPNPFTQLTSLDLTLVSGEALEIPVIFGTPSFSRLKKLKLRSDFLLFSIYGSICHADYALMLRSVAPDFNKIKKPSVKYFDSSRVPPPPPDSHPKWDSLEGSFNDTDTALVLANYRGPSLDLLDLTEVKMVWTAEW